LTDAAKIIFFLAAKRGATMNNDPLKEYLKETEPDKLSKGYVWGMVIGLQAAVGLIR